MEQPAQPNVHRYTPNFVTRDEEHDDHLRADTLDELMAIEWVKHAAHDYPGEPFRRFSVCRDDPRQYNLMAEYKGGEVWWVVARLDDPDLYDLPTWDDDGIATRVVRENSKRRERERREWLKANPTPDPQLSQFCDALKGLWKEEDFI